MKALKHKVYQAINEQIRQKIQIAEAAIASAQESRDSDTKSSAGDKYETGREMMQLEMEKNSERLQNALGLQKELAQIDLEKVNAAVGFGSMVRTDKGIYFISIGLGAVKIDGRQVFVISLASPLGALMKDKVVGERFSFRGQQFVVEEIG